MKATYGSNNCFLLRTNSRPPGKVEQLPDPWCRFINRRMQIATQENVIDSSPSTIRSFLETPESNRKNSEDGNNLEYHPLSPDHTSVNICDKFKSIYKILML